MVQRTKTKSPPRWLNELGVGGDEAGELRGLEGLVVLVVVVPHVGHFEGMIDVWEAESLSLILPQWTI